MKYLNAPIREAVFDIRVDKLEINDVHDLLQMKELITNDFPVKDIVHNITGMLEFSPFKPNETKTVNNLNGFIFISEDKTKQLQVRLDGLTFNVLKPYDNWETHFDLFIKVWNIYNDKFKPNQINRIASRFINRIEIPIPLNSFQDYFSNMPPIPKCLPQTITNFFMQIQVPCDNLRTAVITETIEPLQEKILPFILDIDVSQKVINDNSIENLVSIFNEIRILKNNIFENCITDKTRNLIS